MYDYNIIVSYQLNNSHNPDRSKFVISLFSFLKMISGEIGLDFIGDIRAAIT